MIRRRPAEPAIPAAEVPALVPFTRDWGCVGSTGSAPFIRQDGRVVTASAPPARPPRFRFTPRRVGWSLDRTRSAQLWDELGACASREGIARFRFAAQSCWAVTDPAWARQVLTAPPDVVARSGSFRKLRTFLGDSLITTEGPAHRTRRRQVQPAFQRQRLEAYAGSMVAAAQATAQQWQDGQRVAMEQQMAALAMDAIGRAVLGVDGRALAPVIGASLEQLMRAMPLLFIPHFERFALAPIPGLGWLRHAFGVLDGIARESATSSDAELVRALRAAAADVPELSQDEVRDELLTLLLAGHETTAVTLTWTWWLLDRHPQAAARIREEVARVVGGREPTYDDVGRLAYTQGVVAETLRLRPPAWINERQVVGALELGPHRPPRGTVLLIPTWVLHRDRRWWQDPQEFQPERWLDSDGRYNEKSPGQPRGAYLPFGAGAHACIGSSFAWTEAVLALAVLAPRWRPAVTDDARVAIRASVTLRPAHGMPMRLHALA